MPSGLARLKRRADFLRVAAARRRAVRDGLILQAAPRPKDQGPQDQGPEDQPGELRIGYTASKRVGNAVARNRAKRRLRAAAAEVLGRDGRKGTDYVLIARDKTPSRPYRELVADLAGALRQVERRRAGEN